MILKKHSKKTLTLLLAFSLIFGQTTSFAELDIVKRSDAPAKYKWDLTTIYKTPGDFQKELKSVEKEIPKLTALKGKLTTTTNIRKYFDLVKSIGKKVDKLMVYGYFNYSLNQADSKSQEMNSAAESLATKFSSAKSFADPELLKLSTSKIKSMMKNKQMADLNMYFDELLKTKAHTLSAPEEKILSDAGEMAATPNSIYDMITVADSETPIIKDKEGKDVKVTRSMYSKLLEDNDRDMRKAGYEAQFGTYKAVNNTLGANYAGQIKANMFYANAKKYDGSLDAALQQENIDKKIYNNLVSSVGDNLSYLHKYFDLKKKYLGVDELHFYDIYKPLVSNYTMEYSYDDANKMILTALKPLGKEYTTVYQKAIDSRWIDVYEDENKETGAYQWGAYDTHPFVLMNYDNSLDSALTMAHEMGHAMNSYYTNKTQDYLVSDYPIFTAEVASTMNELLVMDYLIKNAKSDDEKLYLINQQVENIKGTVYQQVMYSEFEQKAHALIESGEPGSAEAFNKIWEDVVKKYYGKSFVSDDFVKYGWSRIPHFYSSFYVYKYATSFSAAYSLSKNITTGNQKSIDKYMNFLAAGKSDYPVDVLKDAGVDMNTSKPVDDVLKYFGSLVDQMDTLLAKKASATNQ